jgi:hypothetical protein
VLIDAANTCTQRTLYRVAVRLVHIGDRGRWGTFRPSAKRLGRPARNFLQVENRGFRVREFFLRLAGKTGFLGVTHRFQ